MAPPISGAKELHPLLADAARGALPSWTEAGADRRGHMDRVAALLAEWALERGEDPGEVKRWRAAGNLHDALRDADHEALRRLVDPPLRNLPGKVLHGPGAAARLRETGVADEEFLHAVTYHTLGSAGFGTLGMALFAADFLEPGRKLQFEWKETLRARASRDLDGVVREILLARIRYQVGKGRPLHPETVAFWNRMAEGQDWASASEL